MYVRWDGAPCQSPYNKTTCRPSTPSRSVARVVAKDCPGPPRGGQASHSVFRCGSVFLWRFSTGAQAA